MNSATPPARAASTSFDRHLIASPADMALCLERTDRDDAAVVALLSAEGCADLLAASSQLTYRDARPVIGEGEKAVYQDFEICMPVPEASRFHHCRDALERLLNRALGTMPMAPLAKVPPLNDVVVQRYPAGSRGISAHRDHLSYRDLVAIVTLAGQARFFVSRDRSGANAREIPIPAGSLLLMRAPGFGGSEDRPFHFLSDVSEERVCLGLRHDIRSEADGG